MMNQLREDAHYIIKEAIQFVQPDAAVIRALEKWQIGSRITLIAAGKAAWKMAKAAQEYLGSRIAKGVVITKYGHVKVKLPGIACYEGGHPVPDENSFLGTQSALDVVSNLDADDSVLFLLSGGGSALFEKPLISKIE